MKNTTTSRMTGDRVLVTDTGSSGPDGTYSDSRHTALKAAIESHGGKLSYGQYQTIDEVIDGCADADILLASKAPITREVIEENEIEYIIRTGVGYDTINVKAATEHGIPVANMPGYHVADTLSEHTIGLMIGAAREMAYCDRIMRNENGWGLGKGRSVRTMHGGTFGIVGLGHIGRAAADKAKGIGMNVIAYDPDLPKDIFDRLDVEDVSFNELLNRSDCISIHTPLTNETHQMFSTPEFEKMKDNGIFVNTARGPIVDVEALVEAVEEEELYAAGLDNFETEPPVNSSALSCDRIICSPHHGSAAPETDERKTRLLCDEVSGCFWETV